MRTVLVIASAIVNAILHAAHTGSHTYDRGNGERYRADRRAAERPSRGAARAAPAEARRAAHAAPLDAGARDAQPEVRAADRAAPAREAPPPRAPASRRAGVPRPRLQPRGREEGHARARPLVVGGPRLQDPQPRG